MLGERRVLLHPGCRHGPLLGHERHRGREDRPRRACAAHRPRHTVKGTGMAGAERPDLRKNDRTGRWKVSLITKLPGSFQRPVRFACSTAPMVSSRGRSAMPNCAPTRPSRFCKPGQPDCARRAVDRKRQAMPIRASPMLHSRLRQSPRRSDPGGLVARHRLLADLGLDELC